MFAFICSEDRDALVDEAYIQSVEATYNITFPKVLRDYYLKYNGAEIYECPFQKHGIDFCVIEMVPLKYGTMPVEKMLDYDRKNKWIPTTFVPFAIDEDYEDYYWDSVTGHVYFLSKGNDENPIPISDSMDEFFELLNQNFV